MKALLFNDTSSEKHIGCNQVIKNIYSLCQKNKIQIIKPFKRCAIVPKSKALHVSVENADVIIINGEGSLHHSSDFTANLFEVIKEIDNKKIVLINSVWEKMYLKDINILDKLSFITVRESYSYNELIKVYPKKEKVSIVPDIIFNLDVRSYKPKIGYGDSVLGMVAQNLSQNNNYMPLQYINNLPTVYSYIAWLKKLELYITGRFHGVCLSALAGTPFLSFPSNSHKIEGILEDMGCPELLLSSDSEIKHKKELAWKALPNIKNYIEDAKIKIENTFKQISEL